MARVLPYRGVSLGRLLLLALAAALLAPAPDRLLALAATVTLLTSTPWYLCGNDSGNFAYNSTYQANIQLLSTQMPKNASSPSSNLFAKARAGAAPDIVYALTLCRGDIDASDCESCITTAFQDAQQQCPLNKDAAVFYETCYLRFSDTNFFASTNNDNATIALINTANVTSPVRAFDSAVGVLLNATSDYAAANTTSRYATGQEGFDIYALTQCTPDLSSADCRNCLGEMIRTRPQYLSRRQGARIVGMRCNFRYELYPIVSGSSSVQLPAPPLLAPAPAPAPVNATPTAATQQGKSKKKTGTILAIALPMAAAVLAVTLGCLCFMRRRPSTERPSFYSTDPNDIESLDSLLIDISTLRLATNNFDEGNKLGEGGFGAVYKGILPDGQEIAVKRLSQSSGQGIQELKNELVLVAKLQHKNLVRLLGVCLQQHEKLLVYEYMPNRSIDTLLFDTEESKQLDWGKRLKIINGTARGLQYLHEDSQLKIIHRDLKASNVLLDYDCTPKISDFGLARLFSVDQTREVTNHIAGTYGYMAPEYAMRGHYSIKSDVFSFGVLILEILTGRKNIASFNEGQSANLLCLVWKHWSTGTIAEIIDPFLRGNAPAEQMLKCVHIGLLCVQDNPVDRPLMSTVNVMLSTSRVSLPVPLKPVFFIPESRTYPSSYSESYSAATQQPTGKSGPVSPNEVSVTELEPR